MKTWKQPKFPSTDEWIKKKWYMYIVEYYSAIKKNEIMPFAPTWGASQVALVVKNPPASAGDLRDTGSIPGSGRSPGGGHGHPLQCSCLENPMGRGAWWAAVHRVAQSRTRLKQFNTHTHTRVSTCHILFITHLVNSCRHKNLKWFSWLVLFKKKLKHPLLSAPLN